MQTRFKSWVETATHTGVGMVIAVTTTQILVWLNPYTGLGIELTIGGNLTLTAILTVISLLRTYFIRRFFTSRKEKRKKQKTVKVLRPMDFERNTTIEYKPTKNYPESERRQSPAIKAVALWYSLQDGYDISVDELRSLAEHFPRLHITLWEYYWRDWWGQEQIIDKRDVSEYPDDMIQYLLDNNIDFIKENVL